MPKPEKNAIQFESADGRNTVAGFVYTCPEVEPFCILQISHGMCEYMGRYDDFAFWLAQRGVVVCGNDHLGHGATATKEDRGYFGGKGGHMNALQDLKTLNGMMREKYPGLPLVLLGHSMGSFFARKYAVLWPQTIEGLVISGTGGPNPLAGVGITVASMIARVRGEKHRSKLLHNMAFGAYLKQIPDAKTPYDWISRDEEIVAVYAKDELCTFHFTANGFHELLSALRDVSSPEWAMGISKGMPVLMISGDADPVGDYGKGVATVRGWLQNTGVKNLEYKMYEGARHEVLNETNRAEVYEDVLAFLNRWWGKTVALAGVENA